MERIAGYQITEELYESQNCIIFRGYREEDERPVILKLLREAYPSPERIAWLKREYEITRSLDIEGVPNVYSFESDQGYWMMVANDSGGDSLKSLSMAGTCNITTFLQIAIHVTDIVGQIHQQRIIHKDINPANIVYNPTTHHVEIIDFGIATILSQENRSLNNTTTLEGTLAYISPEQTGRMNRAVDYRTDFYSLGVTFYELLTGYLPFESDDAMELVHSHIAKQPTPPHMLRTDVPEALSLIILKLMSKNAESRYQSAYGLKVDLEKCWDEWRSNGTIEPFLPGQNDVSDRFQIPQKLYGREQDVEMLLEGFERVCHGARELLLLSGYGGVGKTVLVQELYRPVMQQGGFFASGKFEQFQRNVPYIAMTRAFGELVRQLLTQSDSKIAAWRQRILSAIEPNGRVITDVIPEVELIIGPQPALPSAGPTEAQNRFTMVFQKFITVFAQPEHPLVLFLDDLQWADSASLQLIESLATATECTYLLLVGAFRDNEEDSINPLRLMLDVMQHDDATVHHISLQPLDMSIANRLVAETVSCSQERARPLTRVVQEKTNGNPFFMHEFLKALYTEGLLQFDYTSGKWQWDLEQIRAKEITDNVAGLLSIRVNRLPPKTQEVLKVAACIGNQFDLDMLAMIADMSPEEATLDLAEAITEGLLLPLGDTHALMERDDGTASSDHSDKGKLAKSFFCVYTTTYKFVHNGVQQAVYALASEEEKQLYHWRIGKMLFHMLRPEEREERIFDIVHQLNQGREHLKEQPERYELAELNLLAAQKASESAAYTSAQAYVQVGIELVADEGWQTNYPLTLALYKELSQCAYLIGQFDEAETIFDSILTYATNNLDKANIHNIKMVLYTSQGRLQDVVQAGLAGLQLIGLALPMYPDQAAVDAELHLSKQLIGERKIADLLHLPVCTTPEHVTTIRLLSDMLVSSWWTTNMKLLYLATLKIVNLSLQHGNTDSSAFGYVWYGMFLGSVLGDYETGYVAGTLALQLNDHFHTRQLTPKLNCIFGVFIDPWQSHLSNIVRFLREGYDVGVEIGDVLWASVNSYTVIYTMILKGDDLNAIYQTSQHYLDFVRKAKQSIPRHMLIFSQQFILCMKGLTKAPGMFSDKSYDEEAHIAEVRQSGALRPLFWYYKIKMQALYLFDHYAEALAIAIESDKLVEKGASFGVATLPEHYFYYALTLAALYPNAGPGEKGHYWFTLTKHQTRMRQWAAHCPANYRHKHMLITAEMAHIQGREEAAKLFYTHAIRLARENHFQQNEALAHELAGRFYLACGEHKKAIRHFTSAYEGYLTWGARAKVKALEKKHGSLLAEARRMASTHHRTGTKTSTISSSISTTTNTDTYSSLDLSAAMKASQAISCEIVLDSLLRKMMQIVIEIAGAGRGVLILDRDGAWVVEAEGAVDSSDVTVLQSIPLGSSEEIDLPRTVINYVIRTKQFVVLDNAIREGPFVQDPYIKEHHTQSVLCTPLVNQGKLTGVLFLENNLTSAAFTPERIEVLNLFAVQAAISIENALLLQTLEQKVAERTAQLEAANDEITTLNMRLRAENVRMEQELNVSRQLQQMLLPREEELKQVDGLDIAGYMEPADEVGGDYYDVLQKNGHVKIGIGDVTGHGLESGVVMLMIQTAVRTLLNTCETDAIHYLNVLNRTLYDNVQRMQTDKSLSLVLLDYHKGNVRLSGQHEYIIVVRYGGHVELIDTIDLGFPIALDEDIADFVAETSLYLEPGDGLVLYTDGITEAENSAKEEYGLERLCDVISMFWEQSVESIKEAVMQDVYRHIGNHKIYDDLTLVVIKQK